MPDLDGNGEHHHFWPPHGPPGWMAGGADWWPLVPGLIMAMLLLVAVVHAAGVDRMLVDGLRAAVARRPEHRRRWNAALAQHGRTAQAFAAFECDPMAALERPALADVSQPATARFVDAFAEASALLTDDYPGEVPGALFVEAAERCARAWTAAVDAADRVRAQRFAPGERALLDQAVKLLALADSTAYEAERRSAYRHARQRLDELAARSGWALPRPAGAVLERRAVGMLAAAG